MKKTLTIEIKSIKIVEIEPDTHYILISSESKYDGLSEHSNVCLLHFADTELENHPEAISNVHVQDIDEFMRSCDNGHLVIACDEGYSRSPAVAAALLSIYGQDDSYIWKNKDYKPNYLVYKRILEYYARYFPADKMKALKEVSERTPEIYRYFRLHDKDLVYVYDHIIERTVGQKTIRYGLRYGDPGQILFIKTGGGGDITGPDEKYPRAAAYLHELYGCTVIVSSNPYDGSDSLYDAEAVVKDYLRGNGISGADADVMYFGYSDGARLIADYGHEHERFSSVILYNLPLEQNETEALAASLSEINRKGLAIIVFGEDDESYKSSGQILHSAAPEIEMHVIRGTDHRLSTRLAITLPQLFFNRNALAKDGIAEVLQ